MPWDRVPHARLLTRLDEWYFRVVVPWLILLAVVLFMLQPAVARLRQRDEALPHSIHSLVGLVCFQFDPEYNVPGSPGYGKFYTLHTEDPNLAGSNLPDNSAFPGFNTTGYTTTAAVLPPIPSVALCVPVAVGLNVTVSVQFAPGATDTPQSLVWW